MVFSSLTFLYLFLPLNLALYFLVKNRTYKNWVLIIFSLIFYAWGEPIWISLLIFSATIDYFHGLIIEKSRGQWLSKAAVISSIVLNLSLLGFFKYGGFLVENFNSLLNTNFAFKEYGLPIGISFYTFQTLSYVIDVYRGEVKAQKTYYKFLLYVCSFHQLVAGPIVRYKDIEHEIEHRNLTLAKFSEGINRFVIGLGKKVLIANTAGEISDFFLQGDLASLSILGAWFGISLFALQIYFDFSGYSDMAIGLGHMFGFTYKENFNYPYISKSATEFWRRWHISLGSFFRDYVYIPLGGNRNNSLRNLLVVWFITGLWHGASWNFILWGMYYGVLIICEKFFLSNFFAKLPRVCSHIYLTTAMLVGWVFFYFTDLRIATYYIRVMFGLTGNELVSTEVIIHFTNNVLFFIVAIVLATPIAKNILGNLIRKLRTNELTNSYNPSLLKVAFNFLIMMIATSLLVGDTYNPFLYFRF